MGDWTGFTDEEITKIKQGLSKKNDQVMLIMILASPLICLVAPYFPSRRGRERMIDKMDYEDAILQCAIIWLLVLIAFWIWNNYKTRKQFVKSRRFLRKKKINAIVKGKEKSIFKTYKNVLKTNLGNQLASIQISENQSMRINIDDEVEIEIEEQTSTILNIEK